MKTQVGSRGIALLYSFFNLCDKWVGHQCHALAVLLSAKIPVVQEAGWVSRLEGTGAENITQRSYDLWTIRK
jgi:hypothetical protein